MIPTSRCNLEADLEEKATALKYNIKEKEKQISEDQEDTDDQGERDDEAEDEGVGPRHEAPARDESHQERRRVPQPPASSVAEPSRRRRA